MPTKIEPGTVIWKSRLLHWGKAFVAVDIPNPVDGGCLYTWKKIRPRWYRRMRRFLLFASIVWRKYESSRLSAGLAWNVAGIVYDGAKHGERPERNVRKCEPEPE